APEPMASHGGRWFDSSFDRRARQSSSVRVEQWARQPCVLWAKRLSLATPQFVGHDAVDGVCFPSKDAPTPVSHGALHLNPIDADWRGKSPIWSLLPGCLFQPLLHLLFRPLPQRL